MSEAPAAREDSRLAFELATDADDAALRGLLAGQPFDGEIQVSLEREPCYADACGIDGDIHETLVARERNSGRVVAMGTRAERDVYINGVAARAGYLGQLRIAPQFRRDRHLLAAGFALCRSRHAAADDRRPGGATHGGRAPFYLASIVADNRRAARLLTSTRLPGLPTFTPYERIETLLLPMRRHAAPRPVDMRVERASDADLPAIVACLERNHRRYQFAPCWSVGDLASATRTPGLRPSDFFVARRRGDRVVGCLARWDQRAFKQVVVRGYARRLARWRPLVNLCGPLFGVPRLPPVGQPLAFAYLSHVAIDDDDPRVLTALVDAARAAPSSLDYVVLGLASRHPLLSAFAGARVRRYVTQLYLVHWEDGRDAVDALDGRVPHVEIATL